MGRDLGEGRYISGILNASWELDLGFTMQTVLLSKVMVGSKRGVFYRSCIAWAIWLGGELDGATGLL